MAYVGSYSYNGTARGITVYDADAKRGRFQKRCEVDVNNSAYLLASRTKKTLYSIADEGVVAFRILEDGNLSLLNTRNIKGMRGCHLATDPDEKYLFVSGYHDGKATILKLQADGSVGPILAGVFHKGLGSVAERNFSPHVTCIRLSPDGKFIMAADEGIDQIKVYRHPKDTDGMMLADSIHFELESAPRMFRFSDDGRYMYLMYQLKNIIEVYTYESGDRVPKLEKIQTIPTTDFDVPNSLRAACTFRFSADQHYLYCSSAGEDTVSVFSRDKKTGMLELLICLPISGEYPKDLCVFPDAQHIASINHESNTITFFAVDYERGLLIMNGNPEPVNEPNCCALVKLG
jgi:6-phosphogluconolactonase